MPNPSPDQSGIFGHQFDEATARRAARLSARARQADEPLAVVNIRILARQKRELISRGENLSALVRRLLDEYLRP